MLALSVLTSLAFVLQVDTTSAPLAFGMAMGATQSGVVWTGLGLSSSSNQDRHSYGAAFSVRLRPERRVSWQLGVLVTPKGYERTQPTFHSTYLEVPLRAVLQAGSPASMVRPFAYGGLAMAWQVACRRFVQAVSGSYEDDCGTPTRSDLGFVAHRRWDVLVDVGLGLRVGIPRGRMFGTVRYGRSVLDAEPGDSPSRRTINRVWTYMLGFEVSPLWRR